MIRGTILHDLNYPVANSAIDEFTAFAGSQLIAWRVVSVSERARVRQALANSEVIYCSLSFNPTRKRYPPEFLESIHSFSGLTTIMLQDEHANVAAQREWIELSRARIVVTMATPPLLERMYPPSRFPNVHFISALPGYVSDRLSAIPFDSAHERSIDISYRGRYQGFETGELGQDKHGIGELFLRALQYEALIVDIDPVGARRLVGDSWDNLLRTSKACLASESGSSIIDWDGSLKTAIRDYQIRHPHADFQTVRDHVFPSRDWQDIYTAASPRIFEYSAHGSLMVLMDGSHSGIVEPWIHYVPVARDGSNIHEVVQAIKDSSLRSIMAARARNDLIESEKYSWSTFTRNLETCIIERLSPPSVTEAEVESSTMEPSTWLIQLRLLQSDASAPSSTTSNVLRKLLNTPLRRRLWGVRIALNRTALRISQWARYGIPWLMVSGSWRFASEIVSIVPLRNAALQTVHQNRYITLRVSTISPAKLQFSGFFQILHGPVDDLSLSQVQVQRLLTAYWGTSHLGDRLRRFLWPLRIEQTKDNFGRLDSS